MDRLILVRMKRVHTILVLVVGPAICLARFDMSALLLSQASPVMAIQRADAKKELKLTRDQEKQITAIVRDFQGSTGAHAANDANSLTSGMGMMGKMEESSKQVLAVLADSQKKRFFEIRVQMMGPPALQSPEIASLLALTGEQKEKVKSIESAYVDDIMSGLRQHHPGKGFSDQMKKKRSENEEKLLDVLNDSQKAKFKEIQGAPFKDARRDGFF